MSQHQPGPYGRPPQQPNPYAQPAPGQAPGFPPQPPAPPYGAPPQQPGGWGAYPPPPPAPPQGGGKGKAIGIAVGAVVVVGALVAGAVVIMGGDKDKEKGGGAKAGASASASPRTSTPSPTPAVKRYKLVTPETVISGEYKKDGSGSSFETKDLNDLKMLGMTNPESTAAAYKSGGEDKRSQKLLRFTGAWGDDVRDPEALVDGLFKNTAASAAKDTDPESKTEFEGSPQRMNPDGLGDAVMKCQVAKFGSRDSSEKALKMPLCVWADKNTVGTVFALDASMIVSGQDLSLEEAANRSAKLRQDVRVEA
ncbi:hypothetical protein [Streptomyces sp. ISL-11]|uniref:hypothetical protein n=1 Tax=Streptomyces sp. ISL-11 TaxID=2819174 RepID=UPI001BE9681C|nr:hypothetical protein [Streptomyces sp. ISL-11]MBT2385680.1 hypothetical protein [Streptomyces sp. ISL-11]